MCLIRHHDDVASFEFRVLFELEREQIEDVACGDNDTDWRPRRRLPRTVIFEGYAAANIVAIHEGSSNCA